MSPATPTLKRRPNPLTIRLSAVERADLKSRADRAGLSVGGLFRAAVFDAPPPRQSRRPSVDKQELARLMGAIGRIGSNVNQLARQANAGSWPDSRLLHDACADIHWMRDAVMQALGIAPPPGAGQAPAPGP